MSSHPPTFNLALKLLDDLSSAQKTLQAMNEDLLRATVEGRPEVPAMQEVVKAQHDLLQAITQKMLAAMRDQ